MWYNDTYGHEGCLWQGRFYSGKRVDDIAEEWARMRRNGLGNLVDERKRRYCRRMYNLSQYLNYVGPEIMLS